MTNVMVDTGFWYALFDPRDTYHTQANELVEYLELAQILIPYPTLYESLNTRFSRRNQWMEKFREILNRQNVILLDDTAYKREALDLTFELTLLQNRPLSLVDTVLRLMLDDSTLHIQYLLSFNAVDFLDVCLKKRIELIQN